MGITITATHPKYSFDMSYGGFRNLRINIAYAVDEDFGAAYEKFYSLRSGADETENVERLINEKKLNEKCEDVLDFLFASDCDGSVSHKGCKQIYDIIKDVDFGNKIFRYAAHANKDYQESKEFLLDCWSHRKKMCWR